ncbi:hypothetical protein [Hydrotalea sp.]|uniref:hypothetical protein n=1 Tax=Hydrotalea sp. TaxID=2881279 RepID=UPI0026305C94|nr:hypothetical protein [Hydrotalea sp.]
MASNKQISEIIDEQAVERQFTMLLEWLNKAKATIETMPKLFDNYKNSGGGAEASKALQGMSTGMESVQKNTTELTLSVKEYQKTLQQLAQTQAKQNVLSSEAAQTLAGEREALRQRNQEVKNAAIANEAAQGSIRQLRAVLSQLTQAYDNMSAAERNSAKGTELQAKIKAQSDALMKLEADTGRYSRNVGNYTGAIKVLEKSLAEVTAKIDANIRAGNGDSEVVQHLRKEQDLLNQVLLKNQQGFTSLTMEVRSNQKALATMAAEGLQGTEAFKEMQMQIANAQRELKEFNDTQKLMASELPAVEAASLAAKGLAGTYAIGAGAAAVFADGNEKVEKELNKLVAIMTVLQGLNEVHELLEKRGAIATIFKTTIEKIYNKVYGEKITALALGRAAMTMDTVATETNAVAQQAQIATTVEATAAIEGETVAATGATVATTLLNVVLTGGLLLGIGLLIAGVVKLVSMIKDWVEADEKAIEKAAALAEANKQVTESIKAREEIYKTAAEINRAALDEELENATKSGKSQMEILAIRKKIADYDKKSASESIQRLGVTSKSLQELSTKWFDASQKVKTYNEMIEDVTKTSDGELDPMLKKKAEAAQKEADAIKAQFDLQKSAYDANNKAAAEQQAIITERNKLALDERREYQTKITALEIEEAKKRNELVLNNDASTRQMRIEAVIDNAKQEERAKALAIKQAKSQYANGEIDRTKYLQTLKELQSQERLLKVDANEQVRKINEQYNQRDLEASVNIVKAKSKAQIDANKAVIDDEKSTLEQKLTAFSSTMSEERRMEDETYAMQIAKKGLTDKELEAIAADHQSKLASIELAGANERKRIIQTSLNAKLQDQNINIKIGADDAQLLSIARLNKQFKDGKINAEDFDKKLKKLQETARDTSLKFQATAIEETISKMKSAGLETKQLELQLSELKMQMLKNEADKEKETQSERVSDRKKAIDTILAYEKMAADLVTSIVDAGFEQQLNGIQKQIDLNTEQKNIEIANAQASTMSAQDKAATIAIINAKAQAEQDRLQLEQKKIRIKQAQFDKDMAAFQIVINTSAAVIKFLATGDIPAAIFAGIEGAVQLATVLAKPIPTYALGTDNHPGGPAVVGDAGVELVQTPSGKSFLTPNAPTLMDLPAGTKVIKHDEVNKMMLNEMMHRQAVSLIGSPDVVKELKTMREMQVWQTEKLVKAMGNKPVTKVIVINNADFNAHIKQQIFD